MRTGLVALGTGFLALAVAGVVALFLIPIPASTVTSSTTTSWTAAAGSSNGTEIAGAPSVQGSFVLHWQTHLPLAVKVYLSQGCEPGVGNCPAWQLIFSAADMPEGNFSEGAPLHFPFLFSWSNPSSAAGPITLSAATTTQGETSLAPVSQVLLGLGVAALGFVGGVTLFLGLFLRGGVYDVAQGPRLRSPPDLVPEDEGPDRPPH
ncbi:MAG: hypothetical protein L3K17_01980 [Thermoplasmata archaeon]|nr:hypothetical protein [Thermoplasmata archaeon]